MPVADGPIAEVLCSNGAKQQNSGELHQWLHQIQETLVKQGQFLTIPSLLEGVVQM